VEGEDAELDVNGDGPDEDEETKIENEDPEFDANGDVLPDLADEETEIENEEVVNPDSRF